MLDGQGYDISCDLVMKVSVTDTSFCTSRRKSTGISTTSTST